MIYRKSEWKFRPFSKYKFKVKIKVKDNEEIKIPALHHGKIKNEDILYTNLGNDEIIIECKKRVDIYVLRRN